MSANSNFNPQAGNGKTQHEDNQISFLDRLYDAIGEQAGRLQASNDAVLDGLYNLVEELRAIANRAKDEAGR